MKRQTERATQRGLPVSQPGVTLSTRSLAIAQHGWSAFRRRRPDVTDVDLMRNPGCCE